MTDPPFHIPPDPHLEAHRWLTVTVPALVEDLRQAKAQIAALERRIEELEAKPRLST